NGSLHVESRAAADGLRRDGRGLLLMPSAFVWPELILVGDEPWQPTLISPARGIGELWSPPPGRRPEALAAVLGRTRARLLVALSRPETTTGLAARLGLSPASVSAHLTALRHAGLLESWRSGRRVFHARTALGTALTGENTDPG